MIAVIVLLAALVAVLGLVVLSAIGSAVKHSRVVPVSPACDRCPENPANYPEAA